LTESNVKHLEIRKKKGKLKFYEVMTIPALTRKVSTANTTACPEIQESTDVMYTGT